MRRPIVLVAGGTGGHVFPALSLAEELSARGQRIIFFTDPRGAKLIPSDVKITVKVLPLQTRQALFRFYVSLIYCCIRGIYDVMVYRPRGVVGFGGYPALTWGLLAGIFRIPLIIHEQNAILGRTNRLLARWAKCVALTFKETTYKTHETLTGLPVRKDFKSVAYAVPKQGEPFRLLVLGGSQSAKIFGEIIPRAIQLLPDNFQKRLEITQQCCAEDLEKIREAYKKTGVKISMAPFFNHVAGLLEKSHFIIARGGASTIAEVTTVGRPVLFVPLPGAQDDHQTANVHRVVMAQGGWLLGQKVFTPERVSSFLKRLLSCPSLLLLAAENARREGHEDATAKLSKRVLEYCTY